MSTQSGALGLAILDYARRLNIGISSFVSVGNKADVSGNDLIQDLGGRSADRRDPALPRELRQSEEVQRDRAPGRRGPSRSSRSRRAARVPARAPPRRTPARSRRAMPSSTRCSARPASSAPNARGAVRRRRAAVAPAGAARAARGDPDQRRRPGHPRRRRVRGERARAARAQRARRAPSCARSCRPPPASAIPSTCSRRRPPSTTGARSTAILRDEQVDSVIAIFIPPLVTEPKAVAAAIAEAARDRAGASRCSGCSCGRRVRRRRWRRFRAYAFPESAALALARVDDIRPVAREAASTPRASTGHSTATASERSSTRC